MTLRIGLFLLVIGFGPGSKAATSETKVEFYDSQITNHELFVMSCQ